MNIRLANENDIEQINVIYGIARKSMIENGNPTQWTVGYPGTEDIKRDIDNENLHVIEEDKKIIGVFAFIIGEEPTYKVIKQGKWNLDKTYGTIHRIASDGTRKGIANICFDFCLKNIDYLRIDTHKDNKAMQIVIKKYGFKECGIIQVRNGERIAFDYVS